VDRSIDLQHRYPALKSGIEFILPVKSKSVTLGRFLKSKTPVPLGPGA
jgi:hypothetical protein